MKYQCNTCFKKFEEASGCYSTPSGLFCVLCYEENEVLKYERLARQAIHFPESYSLLEEKKQLQSTVEFNCTKANFHLKSPNVVGLTAKYRRRKVTRQ